MSPFAGQIAQTIIEFFGPGKIWEVIAVCVVGFVPTFFVLAIVLFVFTKIVRGSLTKWHWVGVTILSVILSPYIGLILTFAG
ncbi:MAG: hypothetical protein Q8R36_02595 [bacterium]|nr:hypothetical protein [bacterium]